MPAVMRPFLPLLLLLPGSFLAACANWTEPTGALLAANAASVVVFGRSIPDLGVSAVTGKDCSIVRLDQGKTYCAPREAAPPRPPYCTRSLGTVDCWSNPEAFADAPREVADQPYLTPLQEQHRTARWPRSLNVGS